jgi:hypothetical protein
MELSWATPIFAHGARGVSGECWGLVKVGSVFADDQGAAATNENAGCDVKISDKPARLICAIFLKLSRMN